MNRPVPAPAPQPSPAPQATPLPDRTPQVLPSVVERPTELAFTGSGTRYLGGFGLLLFGAGLLLVAASRRTMITVG